METKRIALIILTSLTVLACFCGLASGAVIFSAGIGVYQSLADIQVTELDITSVAIRPSTQTTSPTYTPYPTYTSYPTEIQKSQETLSVLSAAVPNCISQQNPQIGQVSKVVDGDTIHVIIDGRDFSVRYIGMDAPEDTKEHETLGPEASAYNESLVANQIVYLYRDQSETDRFDRLLRYVFVGDKFVNADLVRAGLAEAKEYPPDTACADYLSNVMGDAQQAGLGLWNPVVAAFTQTPLSTVVANTETPISVVTIFTPTLPSRYTGPGYVPLTPGCEIKGNVNSKDEKIYHLPGMRDYNKTMIKPEEGDQWFCSEKEAQAAGFRRAEQ